MVNKFIMDEFIFALDNYDSYSYSQQTRPNGHQKSVFEKEWDTYNKNKPIAFNATNSMHHLLYYPAVHFKKYEKYSKIKFIDSKELVNKDVGKYFYPLKTATDKLFFEKPTWPGTARSVYLDHPLDISEHILKDIRRGKCKILVFFENEGYGNYTNRQNFFYAQSVFLNININSFIYCEGNKICKEVFKEHGINAYHFNSWEYFNNPLNKNTLNQIITDIKNRTNRNNKFICFNKRPHPHRLILVNKIIKANIDKQMALTCGNIRYNNLEIDWNESYLKHIDFSPLKSKKLPITYDLPNLIDINPIELNTEAQLSGYIDITSETYGMHLRPGLTDHIFFSEKTFKPIICLQPFIQNNLTYSLRHLKELGYKTFHPYINESYDEELDSYKRIDLVFQEIHRLSGLTEQQVQQLMVDLLPVLEHNAETYALNIEKKSGGNELLKEIMNDWNKESSITIMSKVKYTKKEGPRNVAMIGLGKLGKDCAEVMGIKHNVTGYDTRLGIVSSNIKVVNTIKEAVDKKDIIFIAVPTPHDPLYGGETPTSQLAPKDFDYSIVKNCLKDVYKATNPDQLIVLISTVLPGTVRKQLIQFLPNRRFVYNPYLIAMGTVKEDMAAPEMLIIGTQDGNSNSDSQELVDFYKTFIKENTRIVQGTWDEAESIKIFYNTFISAKLSLVNMIQDVAEKNGNINVDVVTNALKESTYRIMGPAYMKAGMGDGGACHPRDNIALRYMAQELNLGYDLFGSIMQSREIQAKNLAERCLSYGKDVCIVGAAYKPAVPFTQGSYSYLVGYYINQAGGWLSYYDPNTGDTIFEAKAQVYLIGYWEKWVEDIVWPDNCTIIDPWRRFKTTNSTIKVIHYGNTR